MSALDILRRITKPMTDAESVAMVRARYGEGRENVSNDDPLAVQRARKVLSLAEDKSSLKGAHAIKVKAARAKRVTVEVGGKTGVKKLHTAR